MNAFVFDHGKDVAQRTLPFTTSRAGFVQSWERATVQGEAIYYQDLIGKDSRTLQRVPEVGAFAQKFFGSMLTTQMATSLTDFQRETGITGLRADLHPSASLRLPLGPYLLGSVHGALRETAYELTDRTMSGGFRGDDPLAPEIRLPSTSSREILEAGGEVGTAIDRVFDFHHFGLDKIKHTIEPKLEYLFVPAVSQEDQPVFDGIDRMNQRSLVTYGVVSRLIGRSAATEGKEAGRIYEFARLSVSQSYDFERRIPNELDPRDDHFSNVDFALRVRPVRAVDLRFVSTYDGDQGELSSSTVAIRLQKPEPSTKGLDRDDRPRLYTRPSLRLAYRFITDNRQEIVGINPPDPKDVNQLEASLLVPVTSRLGVLYATRYDIRSGDFFENHFGLRLLSSCDCWSIDAGVTDKSNPNEIEFRFQLTLAGLGAAGSGGSGLGPN
jgi:lipopolysaccharide assembly outer membrane protein LptD (OstA)